MAYLPKKIEPKWQKCWEDQKIFEAETQSKKPKYYVLDMFPYPSSSGLHVGHPEGYTATDIMARYKRARGFNVLHPMGWDAFGLPAEQYALQTGVHPAVTTKNAIENFKRQLKALGFSFDWSRELTTCEPDYYKWTQFIFLKLYERGLAYQKEVPVNWCPVLKTVLANEEVVDGKSERGGHPVFRVPMKQWMLKITSYAERLLKDLDGLDWPESTKELQRNWIGRSEGLLLKFPVMGSPESIEVFTTRPDTIFGVTFLVLAPEHPLVEALTAHDRKVQVEDYRKKAAQKSEIARQDAGQEKTGVFTGGYVSNPLSSAGDSEKIPVWIADYVLMGYGTGAVMAVPGHDERDYEFAHQFHLPVKIVVQPAGGVTEPPRDLNFAPCFTGAGVAVNSGFITGLPTSDAIATVVTRATESGLGQKTIQYKLRDWLFSRQRYWGEPFPMIHLENGEKKPVPLNDLPIVLPSVQSYEPTGTGESPLGAIADWVNTVDRSTGLSARRETDTMPGSAGSSWYFLRYCDPKNFSEPFSADAEKYWMPVDLYVGGPEHAVGHLLYSRFWTKVLYDVGLVSCEEPFKKLVHQGMILGEDGEKMSKSRGNVINPDSVIEQFGADSLRVYEMFMGPLERDKPWSTSAIEGVYRFLQRSWRLFVEDEADVLSAQVKEVQPTADDLKITHKTIQKVTEDIENMRFNTAISQMMIFVNHMTQLKEKPRACLKPFIQLLQPFAPHLAEELWAIWGETAPLSYAPWPEFDPTLAKDQIISVAVQVMGKTRGIVDVEPGTDQAHVEDRARQLPTVAHQLEGKTVRKVIFVKDKIINFVVG
jgi:leucyl-tRNA synthetase